MKKSKIIAILCTAILLVGLVSACAGGGDSGPVTIKYMFWGDEAEVANVTKLLNEFNAAHPHIIAEPWPVDRAEITAILTTLAGSGELPDTGFMTEPLTINWAKAGFLEAPQFTGETPRDVISFRWDGEAVAYSSCTVQLAMFYDQDRFDAAGVALPPKTAASAWSWDAFVDAAKSLTFDTNGNNAHSPDFNRNSVEQYGFYLEPAVWQLEAWTLSNGGGFINPNDWSDVIVNSAASAEAIQRIADLHLVHGVMPRYGTWPGDSIDTWFLEENVAMAVNGTWSIGVWMSPARDEHGLNYNIGVLPSMGKPVTMATAGLAVQYAGSDNPEAAAEFLAWYVENSSELIEIGIWMPRYQSNFTDTSKMDWAKSPAYPPFDDFKTAVIDYSANNAVSAAWHWVPNMDPFLDELASALAPVWAGTQTAQEALDAARPALSAALQG